jgi:hypothetical protein
MSVLSRMAIAHLKEHPEAPLNFALNVEPSLIKRLRFPWR